MTSQKLATIILDNVHRMMVTNATQLELFYPSDYVVFPNCCNDTILGCVFIKPTLIKDLFFIVGKNWEITTNSGFVKYINGKYEIFNTSLTMWP